MRSKGNAPSAEQRRLHDLFDYNPSTGEFIRKSRMGRYPAGSVVTGTNERGYRKIGVDGKKHYAHRVAWVFVHGQINDQIDHINHDRSDNRIQNLREVTHIENHRNHKKKKNNTSGITGVWWNKANSVWCSEIKANNKKIYLGSFANKFDATEVRREAEIEYGFHQNHGVGDAE